MHDVGLDRDVAPEVDPVIAGIERLMGRSHAKDLAIESLPEINRDELERGRAKLREAVVRDRPPDQPRRDIEEEIDRATSSLQDARRREQRVREDRDRLRWHARRERADLDHILERNLQDQQRHIERLKNAVAERDPADTRDQAWLQDHNPQAESSWDWGRVTSVCGRFAQIT